MQFKPKQTQTAESLRGSVQFLLSFGIEWKRAKDDGPCTSGKVPELASTERAKGHFGARDRFCQCRGSVSDSCRNVAQRSAQGYAKYLL